MGAKRMLLAGIIYTYLRVDRFPLVFPGDPQWWQGCQHLVVQQGACRRFIACLTRQSSSTTLPLPDHPHHITGISVQGSHHHRR